MGTRQNWSHCGASVDNTRVTDHWPLIQSPSGGSQGGAHRVHRLSKLIDPAMRHLGMRASMETCLGKPLVLHCMASVVTHPPATPMYVPID